MDSHEIPINVLKIYTSRHRVVEYVARDQPHL